MNLHSDEDVLARTPPTLHQVYAHMSGMCSDDLDFTLNSPLCNVNRSCKYEIYALK